MVTLGVLIQGEWQVLVFAKNSHREMFRDLVHNEARWMAAVTLLDHGTAAIRPDPRKVWIRPSEVAMVIERNP